MDSLKKIISVYEEGKGSMPNIDEDLLNLIKIPQLRHRIELQNGTVVNGEIVEEDDLALGKTHTWSGYGLPDGFKAGWGSNMHPYTHYDARFEHKDG